MSRRSLPLSLVLALALTQAAPAKIILLAQGTIPGDATDLSGLTGKLSDGTPQNRLGAMGSGIAWTGDGDRYVMIADRGPKDGAVPYRCRFHTFDIPVKAGEPLKPRLLSTTLLTAPGGKPFIGLATAFGDGAKDGLRLDPEGVRVARNGNLFVSDEYGPFVIEFDRDGKELRQLKVPDKFEVAKPGASAEEERKNNKSGRQPNRGMEGLAISADGRKLYGIMQSVLMQDGDPDPKKGHVVGVNVRILEIDTKTGATREFVYPLDDPKYGVNEILAISDVEFLVLERDNKAGKEAAFKKLFRIDISGASDVSKVEKLPAKGLPDGVKAVTKKPFLDLLDPAFGLAGKDLPEKFEGMAFGPDLPDGRHLLLVTTDNDLEAKEPTYFYAFAIDKDDLPGFAAQEFGKEPSEPANGKKQGEPASALHFEDWWDCLYPSYSWPLLIFASVAIAILVMARRLIAHRLRR
jgi:hypothetical protein